MPDWNTLFGDLRAAQVALWIVAAVLVIGVIVKLWPFVKNAVAIVDALVQLPTFLAQTQQTLERHTRQLENSHTTNMRDDITEAIDTAKRVEEGVAGLHGRMDVVERDVKALHATDAELRAEIEHTAPPKE